MPQESLETNLQTEVDFWKSMALRAHCKCLGADCSLHGSYVGSELEKFQQAEKDFLVKENARLESVRHPFRWVWNPETGKPQKVSL